MCYNCFELLKKREFCFTEQIINIDRMENAVALFGSFDGNIKLIEKEFNVRVTCRDSELKVEGDAENTSKACKVIESLLQFINRGEALSEQNIRYCISLVNEGSEDKIEQLAGDCICITSKGKPIKLIEKEFNVRVTCRDSELKVEGDAENTSKACKVIESLLQFINRGEALSEQNIRYCISLVNEGSEDKIEQLAGDCICITSKGKPIKPKTIGQKRYCSQIAKNTVTIGVGPAGTGKTYLAVAMAVTAFRSKQINRIILTRPAVEAGEKLGFLPGDLQSKVDPYLRPLYDALFDMLGAETYQKYVERGNIEVAPLAYMRGRTLDDSFIILDEAQNTTREQMKMFLTRLGFNSKMVITGDITQIDLPNGAKSGLKDCIKILKNIDDIGTCFFDEKDVVRHRLVQDIIKAYAKFENTDINNLRNNGSKNNGSKN